jgi:myo-inositol-1-phosphate synthase
MERERIRVALVGVGNCASSLVQGVYYYRNVNETDKVPGVITTNFAGYLPGDIDFVAAFDVDERKVGKPLSEAIFSRPNCTTIFNPNLPKNTCVVEQGYLLDGCATHMANYDTSRAFRPLKDIYKSEEEAIEKIVAILKETKTEVLVNYMPVGSEKAAFFYAECALRAKVAFVNAMPVFVSKIWGDRFKEAGLPILGDDIKSQVGATLVHRVLTKTFEDRGEPVKKTYQLNVGGNTDFLNMIDRSRLASKSISKTQAVTSIMNDKIDANDIYIGPSDYVPWLNDNKVCFIRMEADQYGGVPMTLELRLSVEDSPNSAGVITDAIRAAKVALKRKDAGPILGPSSYLFKSPVAQFEDTIARDLLREYANVENKNTEGFVKRFLSENRATSLN